MDRSTRQLYAVCTIIGACEAIAESGNLTEPAEASLRTIIAEMLSAFQLQSRQDNHEHVRSLGLN